MIKLQVIYKDSSQKIFMCSDVAVSGSHVYYTEYMKRQFNVINIEDINDCYITDAD